MHCSPAVLGGEFSRCAPRGASPGLQPLARLSGGWPTTPRLRLYSFFWRSPVRFQSVGPSGTRTRDLLVSSSNLQQVHSYEELLQEMYWSTPYDIRQIIAEYVRCFGGLFSSPAILFGRAQLLSNCSQRRRSRYARAHARARGFHRQLSASLSHRLRA